MGISQMGLRRIELVLYEIGFVDSLRVILPMLPRMRAARAAELPALYRHMLQEIADCQLDRPRRPRRYPRVVKVKMSNFQLERPHHRQQILNVAAIIQIGRRTSETTPVPV